MTNIMYTDHVPTVVNGMLQVAMFVGMLECWHAGSKEIDICTV